MRQSRATLKQYFEKRDKPTQGQFSDFIDSVVNLADEGIPTVLYPKGDWSIGQNYVYGDIVMNGLSTYYCLEDHLSSALNEPVAALSEYWKALAIGLKGDQGNPGEDGRDVEFRQDAYYLQWKYVDEETWNNLIATSELVGPAGTSATISIQEVNTLEPGSPATVVNAGTENAALFVIGIPAGAVIHRCIGTPAAELGVNGDWAFDTSVNSYVYFKEDDEWSLVNSNKGSQGETGAAIVGAEFVGNNIVFTLDDESTVVLTDAKITLKGEKGDTGDKTVIYSTIEIPDNSIGNDGDWAFSTAVGSLVYYKSSGTWSLVNSNRGAQGETGDAATVTIGTVETLDPGESAYVTNVGTDEDAILNIGIPKGTPGTGTGDVVGPASAVAGNLAALDTSGKALTDSGYKPTDFEPTKDITDLYVTQGEKDIWNDKLSDLLKEDEWETKLFYVDDYGNTSIRTNGNSLSSSLAVGTNYALNIGLTIKGAVDQEADLQRWTDSDDTILAAIDELGNIFAANLSGTNTGDQDLSSLAAKNNVLELDNTDAFTPDGDYEPATKKYVDDHSLSAGDAIMAAQLFS